MPKPPPLWVAKLLEEASKELKAEGRIVIPIVVTCRTAHYSNGNSSGRCNDERIHLSLGKNRTDAKMVVLHELAHWVTPWCDHHSDRFWDTAFYLYKWAKLPMRYCLSRERSYRAESVNAYERMKGKL